MWKAKVEQDSGRAEALRHRQPHLSIGGAGDGESFILEQLAEMPRIHGSSSTISRSRLVVSPASITPRSLRPRQARTGRRTRVEVHNQNTRSARLNESA
jgi:hypothetical protein